MREIIILIICDCTLEPAILAVVDRIIVTGLWCFESAHDVMEQLMNDHVPLATFFDGRVHKGELTGCFTIPPILDI